MTDDEFMNHPQIIVTQSETNNPLEYTITIAGEVVGESDTSDDDIVWEGEDMRELREHLREHPEL
mgnify:CR=1 FL=1